MRTDRRAAKADRLLDHSRGLDYSVQLPCCSAFPSRSAALGGRGRRLRPTRSSRFASRRPASRARRRGWGRLCARWCFALALLGFVTGCQPGLIGSSPGPTGAVGLNLNVGSYRVTRLGYVITRAGEVIRSDSFAVDAIPGAGIQAQIGSIPVGGPYDLALTAFDGAARAICRGASAFSIASAGARVGVEIVLLCEPPGAGEVTIDATLDFCPVVLDSLMIAPDRVELGTDAKIEVSASNFIDLVWSSSSGSFDDSGAASTTFSCAERGIQTITATATGALSVTGRPCTTSLSSTIECL